MFQIVGSMVVAEIERAAGAVAVGLGDEDAALLVHVKRDGIAEDGLGGPELRLETRGELHATGVFPSCSTVNGS